MFEFTKNSVDFPDWEGKLLEIMFVPSIHTKPQTRTEKVFGKDQESANYYLPRR